MSSNSPQGDRADDLPIEPGESISDAIQRLLAERDSWRALAIDRGLALAQLGERPSPALQTVARRGW